MIKSKISANAQYNVAKSDSLAVRVAAYQRQKMFASFLTAMEPGRQDTILDIGVTSDQTYSHSNYLELWYPFKDRITACGIDDASFLEVEYPGMTFVKADGRNLPFGDRTYDFVHSSAVLEHAGNRASQTQFISELWRVARRGLFLTTPNRWFPIEFHTVLPVLHWLPPATFRAIMRRTGREFFADEKNLNLLGARDLKEIATAASIASPNIQHVTLGLWPTNLLLIGKRQ